MRTLTVKTKSPKEVVDITPKVQKLLDNFGITEGLCYIFTAHTTCSLTTADLDPGTDEDMLDAFDKIIPNLNYRHPHNPEHVGDHIISSIIGPSVFVPVKEGKLILGTWQRIVLVELNGPRERNLFVEFK